MFSTLVYNPVDNYAGEPGRLLTKSGRASSIVENREAFHTFRTQYPPMETASFLAFRLVRADFRETGESCQHSYYYDFNMIYIVFIVVRAC